MKNLCYLIEFSINHDDLDKKLHLPIPISMEKVIQAR